MFRIGGLRGKCANGVGVRALLVLTGVLLGFGEYLMADGSLKAPDWETPHRITSDDGFAELRWARDPSAGGGLYRLHEFNHGNETAIFVEGEHQTLYRIEPGLYQFQVQHCERNPDGFPVCGKLSRKLELVVSEALNDLHSGPADDAEPMHSPELYAAAAGGPDRLKPGTWYSPARNGHGYSFYWANRLALPETHQLFGFQYDLVGVWYTYEAKNRYQDFSSSCWSGLACDWIYNNYRPVALSLKLVQDGTDSFSGGVYITRNGLEILAGSAEVTFGLDNQTAAVTWSANFKFQQLIGQDEIVLTVGVADGDDRNITHYAGIWEPPSMPGIQVIDDIGTFSEAINILFADGEGDVTWVQASNGSTPVSNQTPLCFYYVFSGYAPDSYGDISFYESGCNSDLPASNSNRNGRREFTGFEEARLWADFQLPAGLGEILVGSPDVPESLVKTVSFHRVWYSDDEAGCDIDSLSTGCSVDVSWFTDGDYPDASLFLVDEASGSKSFITSSTAPAVLKHAVELNEPGQFRFQLHMGSTADSTVIARSSILSVSESVVAAPGNLVAQWLDESQRQFQVEWTHIDPVNVALYQLEETGPSNSVTIHEVSPGHATSREFNRLAGPFGEYGYRVRACRQGPEQLDCSDWSAGIPWYVAPPDDEPDSLIHPWGDNAEGSGSLIVNLVMDYAMGYHFRPESDGYVNALGGLFNGTKTVRLFERSSGIQLAEALVTADNQWRYSPVQPVAVKAGSEYTVAVYLEGSGGSYYSTTAFPATYSGITILGSTYAATSADPLAVPVNLTTTTMWGQADIGFEPGTLPPPPPDDPDPANPEVPPEPAAKPDFSLDGASVSVGTINGEFSVDERGAANYRIPIQVAPGSGGLAPRLSLEYSSQAGNGVAGVGWHIGGLSAITRCPQTAEQDGIEGNRTISLTYQDRFCLDGQRLMLVSGSYGQDGAEYRTEIDDYRRIVSYGQSGQGPVSFKVWQGDGSVSHYGNDQQARLGLVVSGDDQTILTWAIDRLEDAVGNYIEYQYQKPAGDALEMFLDRVRYTGNVNAGTVPYAEIDFVYQGGRSDVPVSWLKGTSFGMTRLLVRVDSRAKVRASDSDMTSLQSLFLSYGSDGFGRKLLQQVDACNDAMKSYCFDPTVFDWLKTEHTINGAGIVIGELFSREFRALALGDINGDGRTDLLITEGKRNFNFKVAFAQPDGSYTLGPDSYAVPADSDKNPVRIVTMDFNADGYQDVLYPKPSTDSVYWVARLSDSERLGSEQAVSLDCCGETNPVLAQVLDFNGDGRADLLTHRGYAGARGEGQLVVLLNQASNGGATVFSSAQNLSVDFSRELFPEGSGPNSWTPVESAPYFRVTSARSAVSAQPFDFNGDGRVDLVAKISREYQKCDGGCTQNQAARLGSLEERLQFGDEPEARENHALATFYIAFEASEDGRYVQKHLLAVGAADQCGVPAACNPWSHLPAVEALHAVDINGDGLADIAYRDAEDDWYYQLNTGSDFLTPQLAARPPDGVRSERAWFVDLTGDGYPEFLYPSHESSNTANWVVHVNDLGSGFAAKETSSIRTGSLNEGDSSILIDVNADGMLDNLFIDFRRGSVNSDGTRVYLGQNLFTGRRAEAENMLETITTGTGASTLIEYKPMTDPAVYTRMRNATSASWGRGSTVFDFLAPMYLVSSVSSSAPSHDNVNATQRRQYHYVGGKIQAGGRGFLGFSEVIEWNTQSGFSEHAVYRQDFPYTGSSAERYQFLATSQTGLKPVTDVLSAVVPSRPAITTQTAPEPPAGRGMLIAHEVNGWAAVETHSGRGAYSIRIDNSLKRSWALNGELMKKVYQKISYGSFGGVLESTTETHSTESGEADLIVFTENRFLQGNSANWLIHLVAGTTVTHRRKGMPEIVRRSAAEYDLVSGLKTREIIEPDKVAFRVTSDYEHDHFGNTIRTTVAARDVSERFSHLDYDPLGRFSIREINHYGQVISRINEWDVFGTPIEVQDIDGVLTLSGTDPMGRAYVNWTESGAWQRKKLRKGAGSLCPAATSWYEISHAGDQPERRTCFDSLGREIRKSTRGFDGRWIHEDTGFDVNGRPVRVSEPYFAGSTRYWNTSYFDELGRILEVDAAGGSDLLYAYGANVGDRCGVDSTWAIRITDSKGQDRIEVTNVLGEKIAVYDDLCGLVRYEYDAIGNLIEVTGADQTRVMMEYDGASRKIASHDPDKGYWQYAWNGLGELVRQLDAKGQAIDYEYDSMGRVVERRELAGLLSLTDGVYTVLAEELTRWNNSTSGSVRGKAQPDYVIYQVPGSSEVIHRKDFYYDDFGRVKSVHSLVKGQQFVEETTYDQYGRLFQEFDASGDYRGVRYSYNSYGYVANIRESREGVDGLVYRQILAMDARGNVTHARLGNGVENFASYDTSSGQLQKLEAYDVMGRELQETEYDFDSLGNLVERRERSNGRDLSETFQLDARSRLTQVDLTAPAQGISTPTPTLELVYSSSGNIEWKSDVGSYLYGEGAAGPHAVTSAGGESYTYDANGNQLSGSGRTISYTSFDKVGRISRGGETTEFSYGIAHRRIFRQDDNAIDSFKTTRYIGNVEYIETAAEAYFKRRVAGIAIVDFYPASGAEKSRFLVKDHLGSIHNITGEEGRIETAVWLSFDPFGKRRSAETYSPLGLTQTSGLNELTSRGFTGHEHVDSMGLIHMNGRIFDPQLARFLQADPMVQAPENSQALNRYSYALNNPLSYTDSSGFFFKRFFKRWGRLIAALALSVLLPGPGGMLATYFNVGNVYLQAAITGFVAGAITSGSLKGAVIGAITAVAVAGVVKAFSTSSPSSTPLAKPDDLTPTEAQIDQLFGGNAEHEGLFRIAVNTDGKVGRIKMIKASDIVNGDKVVTNGMLNHFGDAVRNGTAHLHQVGTLSDSWILNFNPTRGFFADMAEVFQDVLGAHTGWTQSSLAENLANTLHTVSENGIAGIQLIGHSQGGAITASALRYAAKSGLSLSSLSGGGVALHGAPVNAWMARKRLSAGGGFQIASRAQFGDAVHVFGGLNIGNPLEIPVALLRLPALFYTKTGVSPHTNPCSGITASVCRF